MIRLLLALALVPLAACAGDGADAPSLEEAHAADSAALPYRLDEPEAAFALPTALREISGLAPLGPDRLVAVQDEDGLLFVLDRATAEVLAEVPFADAGDYEGVAVAPADTATGGTPAGAAVWVLESDGTLYEVAGLAAGAPAATRYEAPLPRRCDAEGLGFETAGHRLLIACKENPGPELPDTRAIYAFSLREKRLSEHPVFLLDRRRLDAGGASFMPSAVAVHPRTGEVYVLSAARRALAVLGPEGTLAAALTLPAHLYPQPEALAFFPDGTLFIASEGAAGAALLLRFSEVTP